jgi:outer membrane receptor protein involved in Fe transport
LNLSGGMRYEQNTINGPKTVPFRLIDDIKKDSVYVSPNDGRYSEAKPVFRLGANYKVGDFTYIRSSWGQGYRFPTIAELFISTSAGGLPIRPNPVLTSETGWTAELGVKQGLKIGSFTGFIDGSVFWSQYSNMMEFQVKSFIKPVFSFLNFQSQNVGNTDIKGFEISMAGQSKIGEVTSSVLIGYTYINPTLRNFNPEKDTITSSANFNVLKYRFNHNFKFDLDMTYKSVGFGISAQYNSFMEAVDRILAPDESLSGIDILKPFIAFTRFRKDHPNGFLLLDIRASYKPIDKLKLSILLGNVLNSEYAYRPALLEAPRNLAFRVDWRF